MKEYIEEFLIIVGVISIIIFLCFLVLNAFSPYELPPPNTTLTYVKCCDGNFCTDTYYSEDRDKCILSLCEGSPLIFNKAKCEYEPSR